MATMQFLNTFSSRSTRMQHMMTYLLRKGREGWIDLFYKISNTAAISKLLQRDISLKSHYIRLFTAYCKNDISK